MNEQQLITFVEVARKRHFRQAAEVLNLTQPAVSAQIRSLEEELGTKLFIRSQVRLTPAGTTFLPYAKKILDLMEESKEAAGGWERKPKGPLTLGIPSGLSLAILPRLAKYFLTRHPDLPLRLLSVDSTRTVSHMSEGLIDLGVMFDLEPVPAHLRTQALFYDTFVLIVSRNHPSFRDRSHVSPEELEKCPLILFASGTAERILLDSLLERHQIRVRGVMEITGVEEIKQLVADGFGMALVPSVTVDDNDSVRRIRITGFEHSVTISLCHPEPKYLTRTAKRVIEDIRGIYPGDEP
jgi:DNA-binding transcriptional LysR family regulator